VRLRRTSVTCRLLHSGPWLEAEARRAEAEAVELPKELGGRDGPEPVRYGDWEKKGIAIDF